MKKISSIFLIVLSTFLLAVFSASAHNNVSDMDIDVVLKQDGSAFITQTFYASLDEGTEFYIYNKDSGYLTVSNFSVKDENRTFEFLENWNSSASRSAKEGKCGIKYLQDGYELCWGVGEYGTRQYTISYQLHNLAAGFTDADGFNHYFVNPDMNFFPTNINLTMSLENGTPIVDQTCDIWGFGCDGATVFDNGKILSYSSSPLRGNQYLILMVRFDKGIINPVRTDNRSFEEVKELAFKGAEAENKEEFFAMVLGIIAGFFPFILGIIAFVLSFLRKRTIKMFAKSAGYFRDVPNNGDMNSTYYLGTKFGFCQESSILASRMLKLVVLGSLEPLKTQKGRKNEVNLALVSPPGNRGDEYDNELYDILETASGLDGILQPKELEKFSKKNYETVRNFIDECSTSGHGNLIRRKSFIKPDTKSIKYLTDYGKDQLAQAFGLKNYLEDFSLIAEREIQEIAIWREYMIYAMLMGIADKLAKEMQELYPQLAAEMETYQPTVISINRYNTLMYTNMINAERRAAAARNAGSGGSNFSFGGGGASGGGGGGVR